MQQTLKLTVLASVLAFTAVQVRADQTNLVQEMTIQLSGLKQGPTTTNRQLVVTDVADARVNSAQVIAALATATGNTFSRSAKLLVITPLPDGAASVAVQDGTTRVDVSAFFEFTQQGGTVNSSVTNVRNGRGSSSIYSVQQFALVDSWMYPALGLHFDVRGVTVDTADTTGGGPVPRVETDATVAGSGDKGGGALILQGSIQIHGHAFEVVNDMNT